MDSLKAVADVFPSQRDFRMFVHELCLKLAAWECTSVVVGEYAEEDLLTRPEAAIVDGIIFLYGMGKENTRNVICACSKCGEQTFFRDSTR